MQGFCSVTVTTLLSVTQLASCSLVRSSHKRHNAHAYIHHIRKIQLLPTEENARERNTKSKNQEGEGS